MMRNLQKRLKNKKSLFTLCVSMATETKTNITLSASVSSCRFESQVTGLQPISEPLAAVDSEGHKTEEDGDSNQRGRGRGREELPVLDLTVPQHRQHEDQQWDH